MLLPSGLAMLVSRFSESHALVVSAPPVLATVRLPLASNVFVVAAPLGGVKDIRIIVSQGIYAGRLPAVGTVHIGLHRAIGQGGGNKLVGWRPRHRG